METLTEYTEKAREFINRTLETPEVSAGVASLSDGAYGLFSASGSVLYGIFKIVKGTVIATATNLNPPILMSYQDVPQDYKIQTVRQNNVTGTWEIITDK